MKRLPKFFYGFFALLLPLFTFADTGFDTPGVKLQNPLRGINTLEQLIGKLLDIVVTLGTYVAVIFIIWSGFLFVKAQGKPEELSKAKTTFFYTIIGVALLIGAKGIQLAIEGTLTNLLK
ncbi:MAG: TrbC/VirB2 family protein [bacterium]|nr:TrbC/VirB2 family protein [bacterium]